MEFRLPTELANKLVAYDQTLKRELKATKVHEEVYENCLQQAIGIS